MKTWQVRAAQPGDEAPIAGWRLRSGIAETAPAEPAEDRLVAEWCDPAEPGRPAQPGATLCLRMGIGLAQKRHWFHVGCVVHVAPELGLLHRQNTLLLGSDYSGACELAGAAIDAQQLSPAEQAQAWRVLLQAAMLLLARRPACLSGLLIAELPGLRNAAGQSPFWDGLGAHFYPEDPQQALLRLGPRWRAEVAALLPRHPVYTSFLVPAAEAAIGRCRPAARSWMDALAQAGLRYGQHVALDDGGPVFEAPVDTLPGVLQARCWTLATPAASEAPAPNPSRWLLWMPGSNENIGASDDGHTANDPKKSAETAVPRWAVVRAQARGGTLLLSPGGGAQQDAALAGNAWGLPLSS